MQKGLFDWILRMLLLTPIRCRKCRNRFYRLRTGWPKYVISVALFVVLAMTAVAVSRFKSGPASANRSNGAGIQQGDADRQRIPSAR